MDLDAAKQKFLDLVNNVEISQVKEFFAWIKESFAFDKHDESEEGDVVMHQIVDDLRQMVPDNAVFPSERCLFPEYGVDSECNPNTTVHVDSFLYDDDDIDDLVDQGKVSRNYCRACGSQITAPLTFISHSLSVSELRYIFRYLLPSLSGKTVVDVGSRLGGVLYGAYNFSDALKIIGIEMNPDLCKVQETIIDKYQMRNRIGVVCADMRNQKELLSSADVIILNNVFQFFLVPQDQLLCWQTLRAVVKPGTVLVTVPSLDQLTDHLKLEFSIEAWVTVVPTDAALKQCCIAFSVEPEDLKKIHLYQVK